MNYKIIILGILAFLVVDITFDTFVSSHHNKYVIYVPPGGLPKADWSSKELEATNLSSNTIVVKNEKARLWYAVFDLACTHTVTDYAKDAANSAVNSVYGRGNDAQAEERAIVWFSVFKRACKDTVTSYAVEAADAAVERTYQ